MRNLVTPVPKRGQDPHALRLALLLALPLIAASLILPPTFAWAQTIDFKADIPQAPAEMKVFKLTPSKPPVAFLNESLRAARLPALSAQTVAGQNKALVVRNDKIKDDPELVRVYVDTESGDTQFTPSMADLVALPAGKLSADSALGVARKAFGDERFIPRDGTELRMGEVISVMGGATPKGSTATVNPKLTAATAAKPAMANTATANVATSRVASLKVAPRTVMMLVPAVRYAAGYPVVGRGSHAVITVASDGSMAGALRRWRTASEGESVKTAISPEQVRADIERQLKGKVPQGSRAVIDRVELAYYDRNADFLQPVYRFEAEISPENREVSPIRIEGFVPIGQARETIPDLAAPPEGPGPMIADQPKLASLSEITPALDAKLKAQIGGEGTIDDFTLGEYANQDWQADGGYVSMSYSFLNGLKASTSAVNRTQWYVAHNWEVVGPSSRYYMNAVNVAYTVPHGDWLLNTTDRNCCEVWNVPNIGTGGNPGFGHAAGGVLATWVIMSCEVIPSMYDRQFEAGGTGNPYKAFDAWWGVFQGMHNAIGFRTIMYYPDDALNYGFGQHAAAGGDINAAWFQEVAAHEGGRGTYASGHLIGSPAVHYDRAATMVDARDLGHSIFHVTAQSASSTLWNFWMGN